MVLTTLETAAAGDSAGAIIFFTSSTVLRRTVYAIRPAESTTNVDVIMNIPYKQITELVHVCTVHAVVWQAINIMLPADILLDSKLSLEKQACSNAASNHCISDKQVKLTQLGSVSKYERQTFKNNSLLNR